MSRQPLRCNLHVPVARPKLRAKLLRRQPMVKGRRCWRVCVAQKLLQRCLALRGTIEHQDHALSRKRIRYRTLVLSGPRQRRHTAMQEYQFCFVDGPGHKGLGLRLCRRQNRPHHSQQKHSCAHVHDAHFLATWKYRNSFHVITLACQVCCEFRFRRHPKRLWRL